MLHVNEDNRDELFRKAAEDYFLQPGKPDWDAVAEKLSTGPPPWEEHLITKKNKYKQRLAAYRKICTHRFNSLMHLMRFDWWPGNAKKKINGACSPVFLLRISHPSYLQLI